MRWRVILLLTAFFILPVARAGGEKKSPLHPWEQPTAAELAMKSVPEMPGAAAVILDYDEVDDDVDQRSQMIYERIKILTEDGKKYADQTLRFGKVTTWGVDEDENYTDISGRTIHADGTVVPFAGAPFERTVSKTRDFSYVEKVFSLPDVQVGSIIEFRYSYRYPMNMLFPPEWRVQKSLFLKHGSFKFIPSAGALVRGDSDKSYVAEIAILPPGAKIVRNENDGKLVYSLDVNNVMPFPDEDYMPPVENFSNRVDFYYEGYSSVDKYWTSEGKYYSAAWNGFMKQTKQVKQTADQLTAPGDASLVKLKKLYDAVEGMQNTDYIRERTHKEEKDLKLKDVNDITDVLKNKQGSSAELTYLFVGLARAAGFKAYVMEVTNRDASFFDPQLPQWSQMDDVIAIVEADGKEMYFDPGEPFCKFGELAWKHSDANGVRQTETGTGFASTPMLSMLENKTAREAVLTMDAQGNASDTLQDEFTGVEAMEWRQQTLTGDPVKFNKELEDDLKDMLPDGTEVKVTSLFNLTDPDRPLVANFTMKAPLGAKSGHHLLVPGDIFRVKEKAMLVESKRTLPLYFEYRNMVNEVVRMQLPAGYSVESLPEPQNRNYKNQAGYMYKSTNLGNGTYQVQREYLMGNYLYMVPEYDGLRAFFGKLSQSEQGVVLVKTAASGQ